MFQKLEVLLREKRRIFSLVIFLFSFLVVSFGINQTGETWDEIAYYNASKQFASNIAHLRFDSESWSANKEHPPVMKYVYAAASLAEMRKEGKNFTGGRIASAIILSAAVTLVFIFASELFGSVVGLFASLILILTPPFIAFGRVLGMDSPTVLMFMILGMVFYNFARSHGEAKDYIVPAIVFGIGIATRYNIALAGLFLPIAVLLFAKWRFDLKRWLGFFLIPIGALIVFYLIWPYLWYQPLAMIQKSIGHWGQVREWFMGQNNILPPRSYFVTYFFYMTPAVMLILAVLGFIVPPYNNKKLYLLALLLVPFINSFVGIKQGGVRYLLFVFVPLAILAALGFEFVLKKVKNYKYQLGLAFLFLAYMIFNIVAHYPYYFDYYNEFMGGSKGNYEKRLLHFGWWGEGSKRSIDFLNQTAPEGSTLFNNMKPDHVFERLRSDIRFVFSTEDPDYIIYNTQWKWGSGYEYDSQKYKIVHEEKAGGAPIVTILKKIK